MSEKFKEEESMCIPRAEISVDSALKTENRNPRTETLPTSGGITRFCKLIEEESHIGGTKSHGQRVVFTV